MQESLGIEQALALGQDLARSVSEFAIAIRQSLTPFLEGGQVDGTGEIGIQQPLLLSTEALADLANRQLLLLERVWHPRSVARPLECIGQQRGRLQHRAQVRPHDRLQFRGRDEARRAQLLVP
jgi:hypothetical protein